MNPRFYDRLAALLSILLLAALAMATWYLARVSDRTDNGGPDRSKTHDPDYFADDFRLTRLNARGEPVYRMTASHMAHYPDDDSISYVQPVLVSLDPAQPLITVRADRGTTTSGGVQTRLYDNVVLTRAGFDRYPPLRIESEYMLLISAEQDIARTDKPVRIHYGDSQLDGTGMEFNNDTRQLEVFSQVRGRWVAPPPKAAGSPAPAGRPQPLPQQPLQQKNNG